MKAQRSDLYVGSDSSLTARVSVGGCFEPVYAYHMDELAKCTIVCCFLLLRRTTESLAWRCGEIGFEDELRTVQISARLFGNDPGIKTIVQARGTSQLATCPTIQGDRRISTAVTACCVCDPSCHR